ncbi:MAG: hypothetical protein KAX49_00890 [Halanaerobiales bacterium]|nr:hypothetical protein [Halanaerobiales bacterium]
MLILLITGCTPLIQYSLQITIEGNGQVIPASGSFLMGTSVHLIATPDENWEFENWSGDITGTNPSAAIIMDSNKVIKAKFRPAQALTTARNSTVEKIDIINMDACLMQMIEVAYEWKNEVDYLVGSEQTVPGDGNDYTSLLEALNDDPYMSKVDLVNTLVDTFNDYYSIYGYDDETYSALNLGDSFNTLISAFTTFATALNNTPSMQEVYNARNDSVYFEDISVIDLGSFADGLLLYSTDSTVTDAAQYLKQALDQAIINHQETFEDTVYGLAILLLSYEEWSEYSEYENLMLAEDTDWDEFIERFAEYTEQPTFSSILSFSVTWSSDDCDLGIVEPDGSVFDVADEESPNGVFLEDMMDGGTESWSLKSNPDEGEYSAKVYSWDYIGNIYFTIKTASQEFVYEEYITPDEIISFSGVVVENSTSNIQIKIKIEKFANKEVRTKNN